jgi:hypothetical protein
MMEELILSSIDNLREELVKMQQSLVLLQFDVEQIRKQLESMENNITVANQPSIGIAPNTPPVDFLPPEVM